MTCCPCKWNSLDLITQYWLVSSVKSQKKSRAQQARRHVRSMWVACWLKWLLSGTTDTHTHTHTCNLKSEVIFKVCPLLRETAITFSSQSSFLPLTLPSIFHPLHPLSHTLLLSSPISSHPRPHFSRSHISLHSSSFLPHRQSASLSRFSLYPLSDSS